MEGIINYRRRMSITTSNWKQICDAPTNKSPAKAAYSFTKSTRFGHIKQNKSQIYFNIQSKKARRAASFGYGKKYDFTKDLPQTPPPNSYIIPTDFRGEKGFCFGQGRHEMTVTGPFAETINNKNPGAGSYEPIKKYTKTAYSIKGKIKQPISEAEKVPGPGRYKQNNLFTKEGANFVSKFKNKKASRFDLGSERFKMRDQNTPGPGGYDTSTVELSMQGRYSLSNLHNSKVRTFGQSKRKTFINRCQTPGPGNYTLPSQFGHYSSKREYELQMMRKNEKMITQQ